MGFHLNAGNLLFEMHTAYNLFHKSSLDNFNQFLVESGLLITVSALGYPILTTCKDNEIVLLMH